MMTPRPLTPDDYGPVAQLWYDGWHETQAPFVPKALVALRTQTDFHKRLVAMGDLARTIGPVDAPLGLCAIKDAEMYQLFLSPDARGTGAATALLVDAENRLRMSGVIRAHLDCLEDNTRAIRFYQKMGWTAQGVQSSALDTSAGPFMLDCMLFTKALDEMRFA
jgi:GNAT superfamily N-acetyltransferase